MPSAALNQWRTDRLPRLSEIDAQCAAVGVLAPPNPLLLDESLRGYVVLLSAHFQGFCRDLYTESAQVIVARVRVRLQAVVQDQFVRHLSLSYGNPNLHNVVRDYERFGFDIRPALHAGAGSALRLERLATLNAWRNVAAHQGTTLPPGGPLALARVREWRTACDELAISLDGIMYNQLRRMLRRRPWPP
ncbi:MAG TPA: hypothetical protein VMZ71_07735 [Gemmataceae bacterium]|nr:hypothetical protein [Gemmataceae bacterium]